jgi:hypothetical protein
VLPAVVVVRANVSIKKIAAEQYCCARGVEISCTVRRSQGHACYIERRSVICIQCSDEAELHHGLFWR